MKTLIRVILIGLVLLVMSVIMSSCRTIYVPVESVRTEQRDRLKQDSIHVYDSIFVREKGDTVWLTRWRTEYRDRLRVDSVIIRDSIQVPYPVERSLTKWETVKMDIGGIAIGGLITVIIAFIIMYLIKRRKK